MTALPVYALPWLLDVVARALARASVGACEGYAAMAPHIAPSPPPKPIPLPMRHETPALTWASRPVDRWGMGRWSAGCVRQRCRLCNRTGHNRRTCPDREVRP